MSSPRLAPWLMPETIRSGSKSVDQAERGEPHAVDRRAVARVADRAVLERDLGHPQRAPERDRARGRRAVAVGRDHRELDVVERDQRAPQRLQALGVDAVVVGEQDPQHRRDSTLLRSRSSTSGRPPRVCRMARRPGWPCAVLLVTGVIALMARRPRAVRSPRGARRATPSPPARPRRSRRTRCATRSRARISDARDRGRTRGLTLRRLDHRVPRSPTSSARPHGLRGYASWLLGADASLLGRWPTRRRCSPARGPAIDRARCGRGRAARRGRRDRRSPRRALIAGDAVLVALRGGAPSRAGRAAPRRCELSALRGHRRAARADALAGRSGAGARPDASGCDAPPGIRRRCGRGACSAAD